MGRNAKNTNLHPYLLCVSVRQNPWTPLLILVQGDIIKIKKMVICRILKKDAFGIASLRENGILKTDTKEKANIGFRQFQSAFTGEGDSDPPSLRG